MTTTDIDKWLSYVELDGYNEIEELYTCVMSEMSMSLFHVTINENYPRRIFVTSVAQNIDTLMLTDASKPVFILKLQELYCNGMDVEAFCAFKRAISIDE